MQHAETATRSIVGAAVTPVDLERLLRARGGFTVDYRSGAPLAVGWSVCVDPHTTVGFPLAGWDHGVVGAWLRRATQRLVDVDHHLGGWLDPGSAWVFLDLVVVFGPERRTDAVAMARRHGQRAVFDLGRNRLVTVADGREHVAGV